MHCHHIILWKDIITISSENVHFSIFLKIYTMFHQRVYDSQSYFESSNNELNSEPSILLYAKFKPIFSLYIECCWIQNTRFKIKLNVANTSICLFTFFFVTSMLVTESLPAKQEYGKNFDYKTNNNL